MSQCAQDACEIGQESEKETDQQHPDCIVIRGDISVLNYFYLYFFLSACRQK